MRNITIIIVMLCMISAIVDASSNKIKIVYISNKKPKTLTKSFNLGFADNLKEERKAGNNIYRSLSLEGKESIAQHGIAKSKPINHDQYKGSSEWEEFEEKEIEKLISGIETYFIKKKVNITEENDGLILEVSAGDLCFDSLKGHFFKKVEYKIIKGEEIVLKDNFEQEVDCPKFTTLTQGVCKARKIGDLLARELYIKIKNLN